MGLNVVESWPVVNDKCLDVCVEMCEVVVCIFLPSLVGRSSWSLVGCSYFPLNKWTSSCSYFSHFKLIVVGCSCRLVGCSLLGPCYYYQDLWTTFMWSLRPWVLIRYLPRRRPASTTRYSDAARCGPSALRQGTLAHLCPFRKEPTFRCSEPHCAAWKPRGTGGCLLLYCREYRCTAETTVVCSCTYQHHNHLPISPLGWIKYTLSNRNSRTTTTTSKCHLSVPEAKASTAQEHSVPK